MEFLFNSSFSFLSYCTVGPQAYCAHALNLGGESNNASFTLVILFQHILLSTFLFGVCFEVHVLNTSLNRTMAKVVQKLKTYIYIYTVYIYIPVLLEY